MTSQMLLKKSTKLFTRAVLSVESVPVSDPRDLVVRKLGKLIILAGVFMRVQGNLMLAYQAVHLSANVEFHYIR